MLGPIILGTYLIDRLAGWRDRDATTGLQGPLRRRRGWGQHAWRRGAGGPRLPGEPLWPARGPAPSGALPQDHGLGGSYKSYIAEIADLRGYVQRDVPTTAGNLYFRGECWLLWAVPLSFLGPAVWRSGRSDTSAIRGRAPGGSDRLTRRVRTGRGPARGVRAGISAAWGHRGGSSDSGGSPQSGWWRWESPAPSIKGSRPQGRRGCRPWGAWPRRRGWSGCERTCWAPSPGRRPGSGCPGPVRWP